jgi:hypothetical protein
VYSPWSKVRRTDSAKFWKNDFESVMQLVGIFCRKFHDMLTQQKTRATPYSTGWTK